MSSLDLRLSNEVFTNENIIREDFYPNFNKRKLSHLWNFSLTTMPILRFRVQHSYILILLIGFPFIINKIQWHIRLKRYVVFSWHSIHYKNVFSFTVTLKSVYGVEHRYLYYTCPGLTFFLSRSLKLFRSNILCGITWKCLVKFVQAKNKHSDYGTKKNALCWVKVN